MQQILVCLCLVSMIPLGKTAAEEPAIPETADETIFAADERADVDDGNLDALETEHIPAPLPKPGNPWKTMFYDNNFGYRRVTSESYYFGDTLKECRLSALDGFDLFDEARVSVGGELRYRFMNEANRLRPGGPGRSTYDLWRWRNYVDIKATDEVRVYVEMIDSSIFNQELPATGIDLNRWNIQNAFVDIKVGERDGQAVIFRAGRQELLYGAQHLISPLDWGNTRRNFEGFKVSSKGDVWDLDAFVTRPVNTATGNGPLARFDNERDRADASRTFQGVYGVYHGVENQTIDAY